MVEISVCHITSTNVVTYLVTLPHGKFYVKLDFIKNSVVVIKEVMDVSTEIFNVIDFYNIIKDIGYDILPEIYPIHIIKECITEWCLVDLRDHIIDKLI